MSPANYRPATPIYYSYLYPPDYSPSMNPVHVDTDSSDSSMTPPNNSDGVISTRDCDMFDHGKH